MRISYLHLDKKTEQEVPIVYLKTWLPTNYIFSWHIFLKIIIWKQQILDFCFHEFWWYL